MNKAFIGFILFMVFVILIFGAIVAIAWNLTMPFIFGLPTIGIGHGIALYLLSRLMFGGFEIFGNKGE